MKQAKNNIRSQDLNQAKQSVNQLMSNLMANVEHAKKQQEETLLEFPCDFPIKVMVKNHPDLHFIIGGMIQKHCPAFDLKTIQIKASTTGKYLSLTCSILATSKEQLDNIYNDLTSSPVVLMAF